MANVSRDSALRFEFSRKVSFPGVIRPAAIPGTPYWTWAYEGERAKRGDVHAAWQSVVPALSDKDREDVLGAVVQDALAFRGAEVDASAVPRLEAAEDMAAARMAALEQRLERRLEENWRARSQGTARRLDALRLDQARRLRKLKGCQAAAVKATCAKVRSRRTRPSFAKGVPLCAPRVQELWNPALALVGRVVPEGGVRLCDYLTKWSEDNLRDLHALFKAMRLKSAEEAAAFVPLTRRRARVAVAQPLGADTRHLFARGPEDAMLRAAVLLQASLRGRAAQTHLWEELARYRDVVQEVMGPLGPDDGLGQGPGPKPRPRTPQLHHDARDETLPGLFANLDPKVVTVADIVEAITEQMMQLRVDPAAAAALAAPSPSGSRVAASASRARVRGSGTEVGAETERTAPRPQRRPPSKSP